MSINQVALDGNVCRDAEERKVGERTVFRFTLAQSARGREQEPEPHFFDCDVWAASDRQAAFFRDVLTRGAHVAVAGQLRYRTWEGKDGGKRSQVSVACRDVVPMTRREGAQGGYAARAPRPAHPKAQETYDEEIPF